MALTARLVAEIMRQQLSIPSGVKNAAITYQIPQALKETGRRIAGDPGTRDLLKTDRTVAKIATTTDGKVPLATAYTTHKIIKEFIEQGQMYFLPSFSLNAAAVDISADTLTSTRDRLFKGDKVQITTSGTVPGGLALATDYYVLANSTSAGAFKLASTLQNVNAGVPIDITSQGVGNHTIIVSETADFPLQRLAGSQVAPFDRYLDVMFRYYHIQGDTLFLANPSAAGSVAFAVSYYPTLLSDLPESEEAENIFFVVLKDILTNMGMGK